MAELSVENVRLRLGGMEILKGVSMELERGQVVALLGPSGSGKTTLLRAVAGLEQPFAGRISLGGRPVFDAGARIDLPAEKRNLGLVFQSYALWPHRTVFDNVAYGLKLRGVGSGEIRQRVEQVLGQIGLGQHAGRFPHQLSGGQQQRVALARALVYSPPVILLDEPLSNLDAKLREEARAWLRELIVTLHLSALCVTHDQVEAMAIADRILLLNAGQVEQAGTPQEMYGAPKSLFVAEFMGANNRLDGTLAERRDGYAALAVAGKAQDEPLLWGRMQGERAAGGPATGIVRLESVRPADGPGENRLGLELVTSMYLGERWEYLFHRGPLKVRAYGDRELAPGRHWLEFPPDRVWLF
ncbi:ABC transporter ATP-binding protein [Azospirillum sp. TSO22-1]|uniref:ABC transporter ATP-binding protein n=1 Tax=Azospirillum sp. TSO22-1 TaxID=716789 RepID=UPI000D60A0DB|nr:ABC transporter ATP-binding protein [Azospirillum sp. TSO22-1]PWC53017.1 lipase [Azospirillum sp. TSO22-1]